MRIRYKKDIRIVFPLLRKGETGQCIGTNDNINKLVRTYVANINRYNYELE